LIFSSTPLNEAAARELINERANQSTRNDPLRTREVKHGLSRSFPPLLWISMRRVKNFLNFFERRVAHLVKKQTAELSPHRRKNFLARADCGSGFSLTLRGSGFSPTPPSCVAPTDHPRNFSEKIPSRASIS
jgi:hypothetical protein